MCVYGALCDGHPDCPVSATGHQQSPVLFLASVALLFVLFTNEDFVKDSVSVSEPVETVSNTNIKKTQGSLIATRINKEKETEGSLTRPGS